MKELNKNQMNSLFKDIMNNNVKKFGGYVFGEYTISVFYKDKKLSGSQRVKSLYDRRKEKGVCVNCEKPVKEYVRCKKCRDKQNKRRRK